MQQFTPFQHSEEYVIPCCKYIRSSYETLMSACFQYSDRNKCSYN